MFGRVKLDNTLLTCDQGNLNQITARSRNRTLVTVVRDTCTITVHKTVNFLGQLKEQCKAARINGHEVWDSRKLSVKSFEGNFRNSCRKTRQFHLVAALIKVAASSLAGTCTLVWPGIFVYWPIRKPRIQEYKLRVKACTPFRSSNGLLTYAILCTLKSHTFGCLVFQVSGLGTRQTWRKQWKSGWHTRV